MNDNKNILLAFAAAQAMKTFSESCKKSGIKLSREVIIDTGNKVSELLGVPKNQIAEIGTLIEGGKTQDEIHNIIAQKYYPEPIDYINIETPYNPEKSLTQQRETILEIIENIKKDYITQELENEQNCGTDLIQLDEIGEKKAWKHIKKILRVSHDANDHIENTNAYSDLQINLSLQLIKFEQPITQNDVELYYYYAKYLAQKKGK